MGEHLRGGSPEQSHGSSPRVCTRDSRERSPSQVGYSLRLNFVENLVDGNRLLPVLLQDLNSATRSIHISIFIFFDDPIGEEISTVLEAKARAGVAVRVLLNVEKTDMGDPFGTGEKEMMKEDPGFARDPTDVSKMRQRLLDAGVAVVDTELDYDKMVETGEPELDTLARAIKGTVKVEALHVDHRKIVTIDGRVAYCGSANFGAQYLYHVPFDPEKDAHDEATAVREAGRPQPYRETFDLHREPLPLSSRDRGRAPRGQAGAPTPPGDSHRPCGQLDPEQVDVRCAAAPLLGVHRRRDGGLRVPEPLQPSEARDVRHAVGHRRLRESEFQEPRRRQGFRGLHPHRERGACAGHR